MINLNPEKGNVELKNPVTVVRGIDGATFFPAVDENCVLSWSNDKELENPAPISLKGDKGDAGYTPQKGIDYFDGEKGDKGEKGNDGYTPVKGIDYFDGAKGDKGEPGYTPQKGIDYFDGAKGDKGDKGEPGAKGEKGETGPKGDTGAQGPKGDKGETGATGPKGDKGEPGYTPVKGVDYFDGDKGPKGDKGDTGAQGPKGDTGAQGPKGDKGDKGDSYTLTESDKADIAANVEANISSFGVDEIKAICVLSDKSFAEIFPDKQADIDNGYELSNMWDRIRIDVDGAYTKYNATIAGCVQDNGTISTNSNYLRTDYIDISNAARVEYNAFVVEGLDMSPLAIFDSEYNCLHTTDEWALGGKTAITTDKGRIIHIGYKENTIYLSDYPTAKYVVFSTCVNADYQRVLNNRGVNVGWSSKEAHITII